ncbi:hypothetical protein HUJ04_007924 [Dendroctonus ponderosae]|nr:hypothetical protein HUJ04_007924 [Dendroctonus ponderosae]
MDFQCVVVYTIIRIPTPHDEEWNDADEQSGGCVGWRKVSWLAFLLKCTLPPLAGLLILDFVVPHQMPDIR